MSSPERAAVDPELRSLAARHDARRRRWRWRLRAVGWGLPALFCLVLATELDAELLATGLVLALIAGGAAEAALRVVYRLCAHSAARELNRAFAMGARRDAAVALLRERTGWEKDLGRAARRLLAALYLPVEEPPAAAEPADLPALELAPAGAAAGKGKSEKRRRRSRRAPAQVTIPIETAPRTKTPQTFREPAPAPLPLQPEAVRGGEDE